MRMVRAVIRDLAKVAIVLTLLAPATMGAATPYSKGYYLHPWTGVVYSYDAGLDQHAPAGVSVRETFFDIDLYDTLRRPSPTTGYTAACSSEGYCVAWFYAMANPERMPYGFYIEVQDQCRAEAQQQPVNFIAPHQTSPVYADQQRYPFPCAQGWAAASLYLVDSFGTRHLMDKDYLVQSPPPGDLPHPLIGNVWLNGIFNGTCVGCYGTVWTV